MKTMMRLFIGIMLMLVVVAGYSQFNRNIKYSRVKNSLYFLDTLNNQNVRGVKTFYKSPACVFGTGTHNVGYGTYALRSNTSGSRNTAIGSWALQANTTGLYNTAVGYFALSNNVGGSGNIAIGESSLVSNSTGSGNTSIGYGTQPSVTSGQYNTSIGYAALAHLTTGGSNTAIGKYAGQGIKTGSYNIAIGLGGPVGSTSTLDSIFYCDIQRGGPDTAFLYGVMKKGTSRKLQINAPLQINTSDTTATPALGMIVYKTSDNHFYGCKNIGAGQKWYQLD